MFLDSAYISSRKKDRKSPPEMHDLHPPAIEIHSKSTIYPSFDSMLWWRPVYPSVASLAPGCFWTDLENNASIGSAVNMAGTICSYSNHNRMGWTEWECDVFIWQWSIIFIVSLINCLEGAFKRGNLCKDCASDGSIRWGVGVPESNSFCLRSQVSVLS